MFNIESKLDALTELYNTKRKEKEEQLNPILFIMLDSLIMVLFVVGVVGVIAGVIFSVILFLALMITSFIYIGDCYGAYGTVLLLMVYFWIIITVAGLIEHYKEKS